MVKIIIYKMEIDKQIYHITEVFNRSACIDACLVQTLELGYV